MLRRVQLMLAILFALTSLHAEAGEKRAANVSDDAHEWLSDHVDSAMPYLLQTPQGPIDTDRIHVVEELGNWGAARAHGHHHQGTDFVLDMPPTAGTDRVLVGNVFEGRVAHLERGWGAYGNTVFVHREQAPQLVVVYAHLARIDVRVGDSLRVGDLIGTFGCTGNCKGLAGKHVRNQVHVEVYAMPDNFDPGSIDWDELPMRQLRSRAFRDRGEPHAVDIAVYFGDAFDLSPITRKEHGDRYAQNEEAGGLAEYLANEDVDRAIELAATAPDQGGVFDGMPINEPREDTYYYGDEADNELLAERHTLQRETPTEPEPSALAMKLTTRLAATRERNALDSLARAASLAVAGALSEPDSP